MDSSQSPLPDRKLTFSVHVIFIEYNFYVVKNVLSIPYYGCDRKTLLILITIIWGHIHLSGYRLTSTPLTTP